MKDVQTTGKADWKTKNEVEDLRTKLEQAENEKKKIKTELTREIDRLRKKLEEETAETESLKGQIRCLEKERIRSKEQAKEPLSTQAVTQNSRGS
jgi:septal ring factor EnvC (AmiA/AmiB activator)